MGNMKKTKFKVGDYVFARGEVCYINEDGTYCIDFQDLNNRGSVVLNDFSIHKSIPGDEEKKQSGCPTCSGLESDTCHECGFEKVNKKTDSSPPEDEDMEWLSECPACEEIAYDDYICHACGLKNNI